MSDAPTSTLVILLLGLLVLIAFFAGTEVALLTINRYRLRHRAAGGDRAAMLAEKLVKQPDRWLGVNLLSCGWSDACAIAFSQLPCDEVTTATAMPATAAAPTARRARISRSSKSQSAARATTAPPCQTASAP